MSCVYGINKEHKSGTRSALLCLQLEPQEGDLDSVSLLDLDVPFLPQTVLVGGAAVPGIGGVAVYEAVVTESLNPLIWK